MNIQEEPHVNPLYNPENMSERARQVRDRCLQSVRERWGDGGPDSLHSDNQELVYHNEQHTKNVVRNLQKLSETWNQLYPNQPITQAEEALLVLMGAGHDIVQRDTIPGQNERRSAEEIATYMREADYTEPDIAFVQAGILTTIVDFSAGHMKQPMTETKAMLDRGEIDQRQYDLTKLVADADLGAFGTTFEEFYFQNGSLNFFYELKKNRGESTDPSSVTREDIVKWLKGQSNVVVAKHEWVSEVGAATFPNQQELVTEIDSVIRRLEPGDGEDITPFVTPKF